MPFDERSPLIDQYYDDDDEEETSCIQKCFTFIFFVTTLIIIILIFIPPHNHIDQNVPSDVSNIPYQYILSHKSLWYFGYLIETFPVAFNDDDQSEYDLLGEIVSISTSWTFGNYEVREYRQNFTSNEITSVKTANSSLSFWTNDVHISFKNNSFNETNSTDLIDPVTCDYKFTWKWTFNGQIFRKCALANETDYSDIPISIVKGSTSWGLEFLSNDGSDFYAVTSEPQYWWNMNRRDVDVNPYAPFPPVIPALYTAYYDTIQRNHESHNRRHMK